MNIRKLLLWEGVFGDSDFYSQGLKSAGWNTDDIVANCAPLQKAWAKENGFSGDFGSILVEQVRKIKPDVVYVQDMNFIGNQILRHIKADAQLLVANTGSPAAPTVDLGLFDIIFSCVPHYVDRFNESGLVSYYEPRAFDPRVKMNIEAHISRDYPVTFIGGMNPILHKKRKELLDAVAEVIDVDFWGYGKESLNPVSSMVKRWRGHAWGLEMFSILGKSLITINCHVDAALNCAANMRLYEATGCGALLVTDYKDNLSGLFEIGKEVVAYRSSDECADLIKYYLINREEAREIAMAGQDRTLRDHTYTKRMEQAAKILERHLLCKRENGSRANSDLSKFYLRDTLSDLGKKTECQDLAWKGEKTSHEKHVAPQKEMKDIYGGKAEDNGETNQSMIKEQVLKSDSLHISSAVEAVGREKLHIERFGDQDCGWSIIPELLGKDSVIYCVGCGDNISFDLDLMNHLGCRIHAFDPTPKSLEFLRSLDLPDEYNIFEYGLSHFDGLARFNPPVNPEHVSHTICDRPVTSDRSFTVPMKRLETIMRELGHDSIDLLKIDIEGAEYGVIEDLVKSNVSVGQICVEFHHFLDGNKLENTVQSIIRLIQDGYLLHSVHKHTDYCFVWRQLVAIP